eukprot:scpid82361/ scgid2350/ CST complex subunit CTC1; Conserved telomere maintenance component 1
MQSPEHLHWVYLINVHDEIAISSLLHSERRGTGDKALRSRKTSKLATSAARHRPIMSPTCSSTPCLPTASPRREHPVCLESSVGPVTRARRKRMSETSEDSTSSPVSPRAKRRKIGTESPCKQAIHDPSNSPKQSISTPVCRTTSKSRASSSSTPKSSDGVASKTPLSRISKGSTGDVSMGGWTMDTAQLMELSQVMLEAEHLCSPHSQTRSKSVATGTTTTVESTPSKTKPAVLDSPLVGVQALSKYPYSSTPARQTDLPSSIAGQSPIRKPSPLSSGEQSSSPSPAKQRTYSLPSSCEPFQLVSYEGVISSCENASAGIFILDGRIRLERAHQSCCQWCRGWRVGARAHLDNVHMLHTQSESFGQLVTLSCCSISTVRIVSFALTPFKTPPFYADSSSVALYALRLNCQQYSQYIELTESLLKKFCPSVLKRDQVIGAIMSSK